MRSRQLRQSNRQSMSLADKTCKTCTGGTKPINPAEYDSLLRQLSGWRIEENNRLRRDIRTKNFQQSLKLANTIGEVAERQGHHPDLTVCWGRLSIDLWTHAINGLSDNDFILAAKIDRLLVENSN